jgi:bifunctional oligoribonuclease and PAP phosphatase NrnA
LRDEPVVPALPHSDKIVDERVPAWSMPEYSQISDWLEGASRIFLPLHESPDGDCLGSCLAFARVLRSRGYDCAVVSTDPIPRMYSSLFDPEEVFVGATPPGPPATHIACLDISDPKRTGTFYNANEDAFLRKSDVKILNLDHHATNVQFGDLNLLDTQAAACAEQIAVAFNELGWAVDADTAGHLLLGIVTDTLGFRTPATTARTLRVAAHMMERGGSLFNIVDIVFNTRPLSTLMLWSKVLASVSLAAEGRVIYVHVTMGMLKKAGAKEEELEGLSSYLSSVRGSVKVAAVLKERDDGTTRVSLRSNPGVDVAAIARHFGGGGHPQAAGATIPATGTEADALFIKACEEVLDQQQS